MIIVILNIYVWFNPVEHTVTEFFDPCSKEMQALYNIPKNKKLDFLMDCGIINGMRVNRILDRKALITDKQKQELIKKVNKYYEEK
jgi:hypothetical protein